MLKRDEVKKIWALRDVSFVLRKGESLGIIGNNGAGKSTLCLLLSQIMVPTSGSIHVSGHVSALLSLGAGFQGDLTGRDNIFIYGIYLGFTREEMRSRFREIYEFSELGEAIDYPVRTYSTGMRAKLAFSIASSVKPEILMLDEILGVGDISFQKKSAAKMKSLISESNALIVVSHSMSTIRKLCSKVIWLEKGRLVEAGPTEDVVTEYESKSQ
jgi:ABC-type polysaccharide/polyol phosphate transport system ATPase subunit